MYSTAVYCTYCTYCTYCKVLYSATFAADQCRTSVPQAVTVTAAPARGQPQRGAQQLVQERLARLGGERRAVLEQVAQVLEDQLGVGGQVAGDDVARDGLAVRGGADDHARAHARRDLVRVRVRVRARARVRIRVR